MVLKSNISNNTTQSLSFQSSTLHVFKHLPTHRPTQDHLSTPSLTSHRPPCQLRCHSKCSSPSRPNTACSNQRPPTACSSPTMARTLGFPRRSSHFIATSPCHRLSNLCTPPPRQPASGRHSSSQWLDFHPRCRHTCNNHRCRLECMEAHLRCLSNLTSRQLPCPSRDK